MVTAQSKPSDFTSKKFIRIRRGRRLYIQCRQKGNGQKFLNIYISKSILPVSKYRYLGNILVPQGAYKFIAAMDEVIRQLPVKEPQHPEGDDSPLVLFTQSVEGTQKYNFKLSAWHQKGYQWHFDIQSVPTSEKHKKWTVYFPFSALPWLRQQMVRMLEEHDGSQRIPKMPKIKNWVTPVAPKIEQQEQQPNVAQEQVTEKKKMHADMTWAMRVQLCHRSS